HQDVHPAEALDGPIGPALDLVGLRHVGWDGQHVVAAVLLADLVGHLRQRLGAAGCKAHLHALAGQPHRAGPPHPPPPHPPPRPPRHHASTLPPLPRARNTPAPALTLLARPAPAPAGRPPASVALGFHPLGQFRDARPAAGVPTLDHPGVRPSVLLPDQLDPPL